MALQQAITAIEQHEVYLHLYVRAALDDRTFFESYNQADDACATYSYKYRIDAVLFKTRFTFTYKYPKTSWSAGDAMTVANIALNELCSSTRTA
jgi:hypothetical protein